MAGARAGARRAGGARAATSARALLAALGLALIAPEAAAGPWLRERDASFLSFSYEAPREGAGFASLYAERGVRPWLTLGVDAGREAGRGEGQALAFARTLLGPDSAVSRQAFELGVGARLDAGGATHPVVRAGLSWGRGFETRLGAGWTAIDASAAGFQGASDLTLKLDATLGVRPGPDAIATLQIFWSQSGDDEAALRLVPSYGRRISGRTFGQVGLVLGTGGAPDLGVRIGLSREF